MMKKKYFLLLTPLLCVLTVILLSIVYLQNDCKISIHINIREDSFPKGRIKNTFHWLFQGLTTRKAGYGAFHWNGTWKTSHICDDLNESDLLFAKSIQVKQIPFDTYNDSLSETLINDTRIQHNIPDTIVRLMETDKELSFLDIGGGLGLHSLLVAAMGHHVFYLDPHTLNIKHFCVSLENSRLKDKVVIINNAVSDRHEVVHLEKEENKSKEAFLIRGNPMLQTDTVAEDRNMVSLDTIMLDDLLNLPIQLSKTVIMKIDVSGYEELVLKGGTYFFKHIDVKSVIMDWTYSNNPDNSGAIMKFMVDSNFMPYDPSLKTALIYIPYKKWPTTVIWLINKIKVQV